MEDVKDYDHGDDDDDGDGDDHNMIIMTIVLVVWWCDEKGRRQKIQIVFNFL